MKVRAFVDAIDGDRARLVFIDGENTLEVPARMLPSETREGAWVWLSLTPAPPPPDDVEARRKRLSRDDDGGDFQL